MLNDGHRIQAITIYLQCFQQTLENNALIDLFAHLVNEPCFNQLRTKEQLGYIVFSGVSHAYGAQGLQITVNPHMNLIMLTDESNDFLIQFK
jgi:insulysin